MASVSVSVSVPVSASPPKPLQHDAHDCLEHKHNQIVNVLNNSVVTVISAAPVPVTARTTTARSASFCVASSDSASSSKPTSSHHHRITVSATSSSSASSSRLTSSDHHTKRTVSETGIFDVVPSSNLSQYVRRGKRSVIMQSTRLKTNLWLVTMFVTLRDVDVITDVIFMSYLFNLVASDFDEVVFALAILYAIVMMLSTWNRDRDRDRRN